MLHADALALAQLPPGPAEGRYQQLFDALDQVLGPGGTLVLPTFTYSATRGEPFVVEQSPSTVGALSEYFRTLPGVRRSRQPIFSVAARGPLAEALANSAIDDCFGPESAFALLERHDGWLACLGCSFDRITFTHYVEQSHGVDYRYPKSFPASVIEGGQRRELAVRYYVRDLARESDIALGRLKARLTQRGQLGQAAVGRVGLVALPCRVFAAEARALLEQDPAALIVEGAGR